MKKFKIILPILVFVLTFAISFASVSDMFIVQYAYKDTSENPDVCRELATNPCDNVDNFDCTVLSGINGGPYQVYSFDEPEDSLTECTIALRNSTPQAEIVP